MNNHVLAFNNNLTRTIAGTRTGEHVLKAGAQLKVLRSDSFFDSNFRGTWTFPNTAAFLAVRPHATPPIRATAASSAPTRPTGFSCRTTGGRGRT